MLLILLIATLLVGYGAVYHKCYSTGKRFDSDMLSLRSHLGLKATSKPKWDFPLHLVLYGLAFLLILSATYRELL